MEARAAEPLLASAVLEDEELDALFEGLGVGKRRDGKIRVGTGVESVDNALQGGVVGGNIVGVWGEGVEVSFEAGSRPGMEE
jgi:RecA/RadA recombinase